MNDQRDLVWMKFTGDGHVGVVACSNDINLYSIKNSIEYKNVNTAAKILHNVNKSWDESFVLVFPLQNISGTKQRHELETGIGDYLISNNVQIMDYYSHRF